MKESITTLQSTLQQKQEVLDHARLTLKTEFVGIDHVIDKIFTWIGPWYLFPNMQESPLVINLWGLTGVGKSSLVSQLAELIDFDKRHYRFDMGEISNNSKMNVEDQLKDFSLMKNPEPFIISFDEFQYARTIDEGQNELEKTEGRIVWKVLDNGTFDINLSNHGDLNRLSNMISEIEYSVNKGMKAINGKVVEKKEVHYQICHFYRFSRMKPSSLRSYIKN